MPHGPAQLGFGRQKGEETPQVLDSQGSAPKPRTRSFSEIALLAAGTLKATVIKPGPPYQSCPAGSSWCASQSWNLLFLRVVPGFPRLREGRGFAGRADSPWQSPSSAQTSQTTVIPPALANTIHEVTVYIRPWGPREPGVYDETPESGQPSKRCSELP